MGSAHIPSTAEIRAMQQGELIMMVRSLGEFLGETETLEVLSHRFCTGEICQRIAQNQRLTTYHSVRVRLVIHRLTPRAFALKFVHHLYWADLLTISTDVKVHPAVRQVIDLLLIEKLHKLSSGEKIVTARSCSRQVIRFLFRDPDWKVFSALLHNSRLAESDLLAAIDGGACSPDQLRLVADNQKWSFRPSIRKALVANPKTPPAVAASQLRHFSRYDLRQLLQDPQTSTYLRRCAERLAGNLAIS
jgi:hypothetical protein